MPDDATLRLAAAVAAAPDRFDAAQQLARHLGASALLVLVHDRTIDALLPAPGFPQTLPGGGAWRDFLRRIPTDGFHEGTLGFPRADEPVPALAWSLDGLTLIFFAAGGAPPRQALVSGQLAAIVPLLATCLRAEQDAFVARGELEVALSRAREVEALAHALDSARSEIERTVLQLEQETRAADEARGRAEDAARTKDEFLAMLGHELRNPLSPILTALQLMRLKNQTSREQEVIERQVTSLMRLVDDLLDVARITRGKIDLRKERVELAEIAARAIEMSSPLLEKKQQVLTVQIPPRGLPVDADPSRLAQVLANLLTNAAKYSDAETTIMFAAERIGEQIRLRVKDQGIGIAAEMLPRVFDLFVQHRQSIDRSQGGLGLGLAIVRSLVEMHGGTVSASSAGEGAGSEFVVTLPGAALTPSAAESTAPAGVTAVAEGGRARLLVVDDNEDAGILLAEALDALGYQVRRACDGPGALLIAAEFRPQMALLDLGLPVMDGYELALHLRQQPGGAALRLVAVTGYGQEEDMRRSADAGFDAHLVKPVALDQLQHILAQLLDPGPGRNESAPFK